MEIQSGPNNKTRDPKVLFFWDETELLHAYLFLLRFILFYYSIISLLLPFYSAIVFIQCICMITDTMHDKRKKNTELITKTVISVFNAIQTPSKQKNIKKILNDVIYDTFFYYQIRTEQRKMFLNES